MYHHEIKRNDPLLNIFQGKKLHEEFFSDTLIREVFVGWAFNSIVTDQLPFVDVIEILWKFVFPECEVKYWANQTSQTVYVTVTHRDKLIYGLEARVEPSWVRRYFHSGFLNDEDPVSYMLSNQITSSFFRHTKDGFDLASSTKLGVQTKNRKEYDILSTEIKGTDGTTLGVKDIFRAVSDDTKIAVAKTDDLLLTTTCYWPDDSINVQVKVHECYQSFLTCTDDVVRRVLESGNEPQTDEIFLGDYGYPETILINGELVYILEEEPVIEDGEEIGKAYYFVNDESETPVQHLIFKNMY